MLPFKFAAVGFAALMVAGSHAMSEKEREAVVDVVVKCDPRTLASTSYQNSFVARECSAATERYDLTYGLLSGHDPNEVNMAITTIKLKAGLFNISGDLNHLREVSDAHSKLRASLTTK